MILLRDAELQNYPKAKSITKSWSLIDFLRRFMFFTSGARAVQILQQALALYSDPPLFYSEGSIWLNILSEITNNVQRTHTLFILIAFSYSL